MHKLAADGPRVTERERGRSCAASGEDAKDSSDREAAREDPER